MRAIDASYTELTSRKTAGWKKGSLHHMPMLIPYSKYIPFLMLFILTNKMKLN